MSYRSPHSRSRSRSPLPPAGGPGRSRSPIGRSRSPPRRYRSRSRSPYYRSRRDDDRDSYYGGSRRSGGSRYRSRSRSRSPYYRSRRDNFEDDRRRRDAGPPRRRPPYRGTEEERQQATCLYVGNLPYQSREEEMRRLFEPFGALKSVSMPMEHDGRKNRGYCFVDYEMREDAEKAFQKWQEGGLELDGRRLRLDWDVTPAEHRRPAN